MNLDELRSVQATERQKDSLQHLRDDFYDDVAAYVSDLRAARDRRAEQVSNPFSDDDVRRMSDEVETAEEVAEALYERRVGKVVKLASFAAADMPVETEGMTTEERDLFDDLVARIEANKSTVLDVLAGETDTPASSEAESEADSAMPPDEVATEDVAEPAATPREHERVHADPDPDAASETRLDANAPDPDSVDADSSESAEPPGAAGSPDSNGADVLTGAMGGGGRESDSSEPTADVESASTGPPADDGARADGPMPVDPEPAPPGAPGVDDTSPTAEQTNDSVGNGESPTGEPESRSAPGTGEGTSENGGPTVAARGSSADTARETVRITRDVGAILGVDEREYELAGGDVLSLPTENAAPLIQRDAAERVD
ncbi:MAG: hypothetical protein PPP55_03340 [Halorubrum sp.]